MRYPATVFVCDRIGCGAEYVLTEPAPWDLPTGWSYSNVDGTDYCPKHRHLHEESDDE